MAEGMCRAGREEGGGGPKMFVNIIWFYYQRSCLFETMGLF